MTFQRRVHIALGACVVVSAAGFGYLGAIKFVERQIRETAGEPWD